MTGQPHARRMPARPERIEVEGSRADVVLFPVLMFGLLFALGLLGPVLTPSLVVFCAALIAADLLLVWGLRGWAR